MKKYKSGKMRQNWHTVSMHIKLHSWLNHQYSKIWIPNLHFFGPKVHVLRLFKAFMGKIFKKPPPWNPRILINLQRFICVGTVSKEGRKMSEKWKIKRVKNALQWPLVVKVHEVSNKNGKILDVKDCALDRILAWCDLLKQCL